MRIKRCVSIGLAIGCLALSACGPAGPTIATVEGTVTMDGKPLPNALVSFIPENGRPAVGGTNAEGYYEARYIGDRMGAIPGPNRVTISTYAEGYTNSDGTISPSAKEIVPDKYNKLTELKFTVEEGKKNVANFDLKSDGKITVAPTSE